MNHWVSGFCLARLCLRQWTVAISSQPAGRMTGLHRCSERKGPRSDPSSVPLRLEPQKCGYKKGLATFVGDQPDSISRCQQKHHWHVGVSFNVFLSVIVHRIVPGGAWIEALPACTALSTRPRTRRSAGLCCRVKTQPWIVDLPTPV